MWATPACWHSLATAWQAAGQVQDAGCSGGRQHPNRQSQLQGSNAQQRLTCHYIVGSTWRKAAGGGDNARNGICPQLLHLLAQRLQAGRPRAQAHHCRLHAMHGCSLWPWVATQRRAGALCGHAGQCRHGRLACMSVTSWSPSRRSGTTTGSNPEAWMDLRHVFWSMRGHSTYLPGKGGMAAAYGVGCPTAPQKRSRNKSCLSLAPRGTGAGWHGTQGRHRATPHQPGSAPGGGRARAAQRQQRGCDGHASGQRHHQRLPHLPQARRLQRIRRQQVRELGQQGGAGCLGLLRGNISCKR